MRRTAAIILGAAAGIVALLLVGAAIVVATLDPNRFVAPLAARVKAATGRTLSVQGPVEFKLSLTPRVVLPGVAFENAPWSKPRDMLTAKRVEAEIALLPLLSRRFDVVDFVLIEPVITLETDASGRGNWEFAPATAASGQPQPGAAVSGAATAIGIGNFEIRQGTLSYRSAASGKATTATIERMSLHARDLNAPVAFDFRGSVDDVPVALAGDLGAPARWLAQQWPYPLAITGTIDGKDVKLKSELARSGPTTTLDAIDARYGAIAATGRASSTVESGRPRYSLALDVPSLSLAEMGGATARSSAPVAAASKTPAGVPSAGTPSTGVPRPGSLPAEPSAGRFVVPDTPLPLGVFAAAEGEATIGIGELKLRSGQVLSHVTVHVASRDAVVDFEFGTDAFMGGSLRGTVHVDGRRPEAPAVRVQASGQDLDLPKLASAAGISRDIRGGKVRASIDITGRGATPHRVASTMTGSVTVVAGAARLGRATAQGESAVAQIAGALDPFRNVDAVTELRCAVFRLPVKDGIAHVDRSIAVETGKIDASASGTLDFRNETLDLTVQPRLRADAKFDVSQLAGLVRIRGRFDKPAVEIDAAHAAELIARIGMLGSKGASAAEIGRALVGGGDAGSASPCAVAENGAAAHRAQPAADAREGSRDLRLPADIGAALNQLLRR